MLKIIDKYVIKQLIGPFFFGFFMFVTVIAVDPLMSALQNIVNDNISPWVVIKWFVHRLPQDMIFTFPMSVLLSTLLVFGRMSKDSETTALKAGGINFFRVIVPVIFFALFITAFSFIFNESVVPYANQKANQIRRRQILKLLDPEATENSIVRTSDGAFAYARKVYEASGIMEKILLEYYSDGKLTKRISAATAKWTGQFWLMEGVVEQDYEESKPLKPVKIIQKTFPGITETPTDFARQTKKANEMSYNELNERINVYERTQFMETTELKVDLALKTSLPFASLFFAIIGASFGLSSHRSGAFIGFGISILIIFVYYVMMSIFSAIGKSGNLPPLFAAWLQNIIFAVIGLLIVSKVNK